MNDEEMYNDFADSSDKTKSTSKSKKSAGHSEVDKSSIGSNNTPSSHSDKEEAQKQDDPGLAHMIADKQRVDKEDHDEQRANKLCGSRSWKTTDSAQKERIGERELRIDNPAEPVRYGKDGASIRSDASTLTSDGGSNKSTAPQNIEFSYRKKCKDNLKNRS